MLFDYHCEIHSLSDFLLKKENTCRSALDDAKGKKTNRTSYYVEGASKSTEDYENCATLMI
jgi:hypothetical protein